MTRLLCLLAALLAAAVPSVAHAQRPSISAPSAILVEPATGDVVFERKAGQRRAIASTTKLMTALVVLESTSLDDVMAAVDYDALPVESQIGLRAGERMTVADLLRALLLESANDAAATLATRVAGSRAAFVKRMNDKAREIGLDGTRFANPIGLDDPRNYSTATDLVKLGLVLRKYAFFRETVNRPRATLRSGARVRTIGNRNQLVSRVDFVNGIKTGRTQQAGYVLVGSATRGGVTVVSAVLGTGSEAARNADTLALLRFGLGRYRVVRPVKASEPLASVPLTHRDGESVQLVAAREVRRTARRDEQLTVRVVDVPAEVDGPLPKGARLATAVVRQRGEVVARVPLVTAREVDAATVMQKLGTFMQRSSTLLLLGAFALCSLYLVLLRRRAIRRRSHPGEAEVA